MKSNKAQHGSGKTQFNHKKSKGESWTSLRMDAMKAGTFKIREGGRRERR